MRKQPHRICIHLLDASWHIILNRHHSDAFYCITSSAAHYNTCAASQASCRIRVHVTHFLEFSAGAFTASAFKLHLFTFSSMVPQRILKHPNNNDMRWNACWCVSMRSYASLHECCRSASRCWHTTCTTYSMWMRHHPAWWLKMRSNAYEWIHHAPRWPCRHPAKDNYQV